MFQGQARGSVGDVVFYRMDGKQISRVRNREPKNPRSQAQLAQRAITATVMRAYSAGKEIFDHSFEGKPVPMGSMREFLSLNMNALRQALAYDLEVKPTSHINVILNAPKTNSPVPNQYIISKGSLNENFFTITDPTQTDQDALVKTPAALEGETLMEYAQRVGLHVGDIFTFVGFTSDYNQTVFTTPNGNGSGAYQEMGKFFYVRLIVTDAINSELPVEDQMVGNIFEISGSSNVDNTIFFESHLAGLAANAQQMLTFTEPGEQAIAIGCIRSDVNEKYRSNETLHWTKWNNVLGIDWQNLFLAWTKDATRIGTSDLILEGGNGEGYGPSNQPLAGITQIGNYLGIVDNDGTKSVLTYNGQAVMLSGGNIRVQTNGEISGNATPVDLGTYQGSLKQVAATFTLTNGEQGPQSTVLAQLVITVNGTTFISTQKSQNESTTSDPLVYEVNSFREN